MIKGEKVGLRAIEKEDLELLRDWRNIPDFRKNFREVRELNMFNQEEWFKNTNNRSNDYMFAIVDLESNKIIGAAGLLYINWIIRSADFSFYIGLDSIYIDKDGYSIDAAQTLLKYGFEILNLNKIWMELYEFDIKKLDFFQNELNFKIDGKLRQNCFYGGKYWDSFIISLLKDEYFGKNR